MMIRIIAAYFTAMMLAGCASIKTYPNTLAKNMRVAVKLDSGSVIKSTTALLDVYSIDSKCRVNHEGRVALESAMTEVGLPTNKPLYLEFTFSNTSFLVRGSSSTSYGLVLTPRSGNSYQAKAQYDSGIYEVVIRDGAGRPIEQGRLNDCRA